MAQPRFYFKNSKSVLQILSDSKIESVIHLYKRKMSVEKIKLQLNIKTELKQVSLYKQLPYERSSDKCQCGNTIYYKIPANTIQHRQLFTCLSCGHSEAPGCSCVECVKMRNIRREEGMKEFMTCMMEHLFPEGKEEYQDPFESAQTIICTPSK